MAKTAQTPKTTTLKAVAEKIGKDTDTEATEVGKKLRAYIRRNFESLTEVWPQLKEAKDNRDGNRYPAMPLPAAKVLIDKYAEKPSKDEDDEDE